MFDLFLLFALWICCLGFDAIHAIHAIVGGSTETTDTTEQEPRPPRTQRRRQHLYRERQEKPPFGWNSTRFPPGFYVIHPEQYYGLLPKTDSEWFVHNIPFIDFPANQDLLQAYNYRWKLYQKHIRFVPEINGYVITEFLPDVPWAGAYNTIPAAAGHHILEGRWIHDEKILNDYIQFWFSDATNRGTNNSNNETATGHDAETKELIHNPNLSTYTNWIGYAAWQRYMLNGNTTFVTSLLEGLVTTFRDAYVPKYLKEILWNGSNVKNNHHVVSCWWQNDGYDAMEVSISGSGCRPTIASAMYGEAETIVKLANLVVAIRGGTARAGTTTRRRHQEMRREFTKWRELSRNLILEYHWNPEIQSFAVIPTVFDGNFKSNNTDNTVGTAASSNSNCDLSSVRIPNRTVYVRELLAFVPWYFDSLIPHHTISNYLPMWKQLLDPNGFAGTWGLRTAELRHPCYNYSYDHGDCWNGPSWPYETARVLTGLANLLHRNASTTIDDDSLSSEHYYNLLLQYARQHTQTVAVNDTAVPQGSGHIFENLHADLGYWNNRQQMYQRNDTNKNMGDDYNHSTFIDLVLNGFMGIRPQENGSILHVRPLVPPSVIGFAVDHVKVWGKIVSIVWDRDGTLYKNVEQGLTVLVNGETVAHSSTMELLVIDMNATISTSTTL